MNVRPVDPKSAAKAPKRSLVQHRNGKGHGTDPHAHSDGRTLDLLKRRVLALVVSVLEYRAVILAKERSGTRLADDLLEEEGIRRSHRRPCGDSDYWNSSRAAGH